MCCANLLSKSNLIRNNGHSSRLLFQRTALGQCCRCATFGFCSTIPFGHICAKTRHVASFSVILEITRNARQQSFCNFRVRVTSKSRRHKIVPEARTPTRNRDDDASLMVFAAPLADVEQCAQHLSGIIRFFLCVAAVFSMCHSVVPVRTATARQSVGCGSLICIFMDCGVLFRRWLGLDFVCIAGGMV